MNYVMIRNFDTGLYLRQVCICPKRVGAPAPLSFALTPFDGLVFENEEEAQATIDFISNVIDFETAECLEIMIVS